jgi:hypothetical protein
VNWLAVIIKGLCASVWEFWQSNAEKPKPITHAETPPAKLEQFQNDVEEFKKRKNDEEAKNK